MGCRLMLMMDELLWVLTDAQLSAAVLFLQSLSSLIEKDTLVNQRFKVMVVILKNFMNSLIFKKKLSIPEGCS